MKKIIPIIILVILAFLGIKKIKEKKQEIKKTSSPQLPVYTLKTSKIKYGCIQNFSEYLGIVNPDKSINISSKITGYVEKVYVKENDAVKKGDILVKLDCKDINFKLKNLKNIKKSLLSQIDAFKSQLIGLNARYDYLKNKFLRDKKLFKAKAISQEDFELSKSNYLNAKAEIESLKNNILSLQNKIKSIEAQIGKEKHNLNYCKILSPINGVVTKVFIYEGDILVPNKTILNIQTTENYKVLLQIPVDKGKFLKAGDRVILNFPCNKIESVIEKIYPSSSTNSLLIAEIRIKKLPKNFPTGAYVLAKILEDKSCGIKIPLDGLLHLTDGEYVLVFNKGKFTKVKVKVLCSNEKYAVIKGNLKEGQIIARANEHKLRLISMGAKVKINTEQ